MSLIIYTHRVIHVDFNISVPVYIRKSSSKTLNFRQINIRMGSSNGKPVLRPEDVTALSKSSGLDEAQVKQAFDNFVTEHPDGRMKPKDFREMMEKALPGKGDAKKMEEHVFRIYDSNDDGYIDFPEFMIIYFLMNEGSPQEVLSRIFRVFDVNGDGTISMKEMKRLIKVCISILIFL